MAKTWKDYPIKKDINNNYYVAFICNNNYVSDYHVIPNDHMSAFNYNEVADFYNNLTGNEQVYNADGELVTQKQEYIVPEPTLEELKADKIAALKNERDTKEVQPIEYNGNRYDYDDKARDRINAAIIALDMAGAEATLQWTTADNTNATVTAQDLRNIIAAVAMRSNTLHEQYRVAKEAVNAAETKEEVEAVTLEGNADV